MARQLVAGSMEWLIAMRSGAFAGRPPVPWEPPPKKPVRKRRLNWVPAAPIPEPPQPTPTMRAARKASEMNARRAAWNKALNGAFVAEPPDVVVSSNGTLLPLAEYHGEPCPYCNNPMLFYTPRKPTRDHVYPRALGGTLASSNRLIVCSPCNQDKADMTLEEFARALEGWRDARAKIVWALAERYCR